MATFNKYTQNLSTEHKGGSEWIKSYDTLVAEINWSDRTATQKSWWSMTTQKHINYACDQLGLELIREDK